MKSNELDELKSAYEPQFPYHDENLLMLNCYAAELCNFCKLKEIRSLLSLGIGHGVLPSTIIKELGKQLDNYTLVEGSSEIIERFKSAIGQISFVELVNSYFENYSTDRIFDALEIGFVLEHVDDPELVLKRFVSYVRPGGIVFLAVPNARSLHRLIGSEAGLLPNLYQLSPYDLQLGHKRYFDLSSFSSLVEACGLRIEKTEGIFLKPLMTKQLEQLELSPEIYRALINVGKSLPEISNSLFIQAVVL
jgi:2-polyprenyl-3-methyl-5-hydroxy-6-metoxy-1,4-benzoquinol methylase